MDEQVVEKNKEVLEKNEPLVKASEAVVEPAPKKKGGRPAGAKDKAPRKKKITIVEEPLEPQPSPEPEPEPEPVAKEAPKPKVKPAPKALPRLDVSFEAPVEEAPPTPRTIMRTASMNILQLHRLTERARKTHLGEACTKKLHSL